MVQEARGFLVFEFSVARTRITTPKDSRGLNPAFSLISSCNGFYKKL
jgi:hypothetical protein